MLAFLKIISKLFATVSCLLCWDRTAIATLCSTTHQWENAGLSHSPLPVTINVTLLTVPHCHCREVQWSNDQYEIERWSAYHYSPSHKLHPPSRCARMKTQKTVHAWNCFGSRASVKASTIYYRFTAPKLLPVLERLLNRDANMQAEHV